MVTHCAALFLWSLELIEINWVEIHYKNGKKEGVEKVWGRCGRKALLRHYKNGIENGIRKEWDEDGKLIYQGNFVGFAPNLVEIRT